MASDRQINLNSGLWPIGIVFPIWVEFALIILVSNRFDPNWWGKLCKRPALYLNDLSCDLFQYKASFGDGSLYAAPHADPGLQIMGRHPDQRTPKAIG